MVTPHSAVLPTLPTSLTEAGGSGHKPVLGFIGMVIFNSVVTIPAEPKAWITLATTFMLSMALAAMGIETDFRKLKAEGLKPMLLAAASWVFISVFALALVKLTAYS